MNLNEKNTKVLLILNQINIAAIMALEVYSFFDLTKGDDIDPIIITGSLIILVCLLYSFSFFVWNLILLLRIQFKQQNKPAYYKNAIIILIMAVIIPYLMDFLIHFVIR